MGLVQGSTKFAVPGLPGLLEVVQADPRAAEVAGVLVDLSGVLVGGDGFLESPRLSEIVPEVVERLGFAVVVAGVLVDLSGVLVGGDGFLESPRLSEIVPEVVERLGFALVVAGVLVDLSGVLVGGDGFLEPTRLSESVPKVVERFGLPGGGRRCLGRSAGGDFARYTEYLAESPRQSREHVTPEAVVSHISHVRQIFLECYTDYVKETGRPVVIAFDSVEAIRGMGLLITLTREWMAALPRTVFILSGRPAANGKDVSDPISEHLGDLQQPMPVTTVPLGSFSQATAERYLVDSGVADGLTYGPRRKLILLTRGHPLWLALTVAFLSERGMPEEARADLSAIERDIPFDEPMTAQGKQLHEEYKRRVLSVYRDAEFWHEAVLRLAVVRQSINEEIWQRLMADRDFPDRPPGVPSAWRQLLAMPWIRPRANDRYVTLHDAVAEELATTMIPAQARKLIQNWFKEVQSYSRPIGRGVRTERPPVIGVENSPGFEMSDRALDGRTQPIYLGIEFLLPVKQFPALRLLKRGDEARALIAFVADPAESSRHDIFGFCLRKRSHVVIMPGDGLGYE